MSGAPSRPSLGDVAGASKEAWIRCHCRRVVAATGRVGSPGAFERSVCCRASLLKGWDHLWKLHDLCSQDTLPKHILSVEGCPGCCGSCLHRSTATHGLWRVCVLWCQPCEAPQGHPALSPPSGPSSHIYIWKLRNRGVKREVSGIISNYFVVWRVIQAFVV